MSTLIASADIVPNTRDIALGDKWFSLETHRGQSFRWADNDVVVKVAVLDDVQSSLHLVVEPGPGLGQDPLVLTARLSDGTELGKVTVSTKQAVSFELPPESPRAYAVILHAEGGGKRSHNDPRVLNFRVFEVAVERRVDVLPAWAKPGKGFYPIEELAGQRFRWVSNDAEIALHDHHGEELVFDVESGPGFESKPFTLHVKTSGGAEIATATVATRSTVRIPLTGVKTGSLVLHVDGGGKPVMSDPRVLNFRVFGA